MKNNLRSQSGQAVVELMLFFLCLILLVLLAAVASITINTSRFDNSFKAGQITIQSTSIELGGSGHPTSDPTIPDTPHGGLGDSPRKFSIDNGCYSTTFPVGYTILHAATKFPSPDVVNITVPPQSSGQINVCVPESSSIEVILWVTK